MFGITRTPIDFASALAAPLDIRARVGTSTSPTSVGPRALTGVGFQPKVVLPFGLGNLSAGVVNNAMVAIGASDGTNTGSISVRSTSGVSSATGRRHTNARIIEHLDTPTSTAPALSASYSSFGSDGFTLNWNATVADYILNHIALGGADLEVSLTQQRMNGTNAAQPFAHGLSGEPTGVLFFSNASIAVPPNTDTGLFLSIGAWAGANQFGAQVHSATGVTTTSTLRGLFTNSVAGFAYSGTDRRRMAVSSVDPTNVNVTYPVTVDNFQSYFFMLAFRGARCQVGTFDTASSNTIATPGLTPKLFLPVFIPSGVASAGSVLNDLCLSIGASDGTNNVSCGISDENGRTGANSTNARRFQSSTSLCEYNVAGTKSFEATAAFSGESVIVTPTTALTNFGQAGYLILGN